MKHQPPERYLDIQIYRIYGEGKIQMAQHQKFYSISVRPALDHLLGMLVEKLGIYRAASLSPLLFLAKNFFF